MKKMKLWMLAAMLGCGLASGMLTSCSDVTDNPVKPANQDGLAGETFENENMMDRSVKPGDDFWTYAQGTWLKTHESFDEGFQNTSWGLNQLIFERAKQTSTLPLVEHLKSHMVANGSGAKEREILNGLFTALQPGETKADFIRSCAKASEMGLDMMLGNGLENVDGVFRMTVASATPTYIAKNFLSDNQADKALAHIKMMLGYLGYDESYGAPVAEAILDIEMKLMEIADEASVKMGVKPMRNTRFRTEPLARMTRAASNNELLEVMNEAFNPDGKVLVAESAMKVLRMIEETDIGTLQAYNNYAIMSQTHAFMPDSFEYPEEGYVDTNVNAAVPFVWDGLAKEALGRLCNTDRCREMMEKMRTIFDQRIQGLAWMSDATKENARKKLAMMKFNIGFPENPRINDLTLTGSCLLEDILQVNRFMRSVELSIVGKNAVDVSWDFIFVGEMGINQNNAFYSAINNQLYILPVFVTAPLFADEDGLMNYVTAMVFGHEMSHGFDSNGSKYNEVGAEKNWWTAEDTQKFQVQQQLMVDRYNKLEQYPGQPANGLLTLPENMADVAGFNLAYQLYKSTISDKSAEEQQHLKREFFLHSTLLWQTDQSQEEKADYLTDPHSTNENRIRGMVSLQDDWYDLFNVKPGDKLYVAPEERPVIW